MAADASSRLVKADGGLEICSVTVGAMKLGLPILRMLEVLGGAAVQPVPLAPRFIWGVVHHRGEALTVVSLRRLLNIERYEGKSDIVVLEGPEGCFGLLVDAVGEVMTVLREAFEPNPPTLEDRLKALFAGTCKLEDGLMVMLDPERLDPMRLLDRGWGEPSA